MKGKPQPTEPTTSTTNFDVIEISGDFDRAVRAAIHRAVQELVESHEVDPEELGGEADVLRVLDPTEMLARRISRPKGLAWIDNGLSDDNFNRFADLNELKAGRVEPLCCGLAAH